MNTRQTRLRRPLDLRRPRRPRLRRRRGAMAQLMDELFVRAFANDFLARGDQAVLPTAGTGRAPGDGDRRPRGEPLFFPRRRHRQPVGGAR